MNGLLKQSYANGWGQAVRFDDNTTTYDTQWKAIAVNSDYTNVLLYNITADQSESMLLAGTPVGPDDTLQLPSSKGPDWASPVVAAALAHAIELFKSEHVENPYWKSSANATDRCCASCFSPGGCSYPCKKFPDAPALPPAPHGPPITASELAGDWKGSNGATFTLKASGGVVTIGNPHDGTSCWHSGVGGWDNATNTITHIVCAGCDRHATGTVRAQKVTKTIDEDYPYAGEVLKITWEVVSGPDGSDAATDGRWPIWTKDEMRTNYEIVMPQ